jgi:hypothetical protein
MLATSVGRNKVRVCLAGCSKNLDTLHRVHALDRDVPVDSFAAAF